MELFEDVYGILKLAATKKVSDEKEDLIGRDDFLGKLEAMLQNINSKGGFDSNTENSF